MTGRSALAVALASLAAGALNYLYQVHAASVLDAAAFGLLSTWLARVTLVGTIATVVQFLSLDHALAKRRFEVALRAAGLGSSALFALLVVLGTRLSPTLLGATFIGSGVVLYAVFGQLQARLKLGVVAAAGAVTALARFALPFAWPHGGREPAFYVAQATAALAGIVVAALLVAWPRKATAGSATAEPRTETKGVRLGRPVLLAFATVLFPLLDVLVVSAFRDATTTGTFSRIALASRLVFFAGAAALQILLPHELHAARTGEPLPAFAVQLQRWLTPAGICGSLLLAALVDHQLRPEGGERPWLYATCLGAALLVAILAHVNRLAAQDRLGVAAAVIAGVVATSGGAAALAAGSLAFPQAPVTRYTLAVVVGDAVVLLAAVVAARRVRAPDDRPENLG